MYSSRWQVTSPNVFTMTGADTSPRSPEPVPADDGNIGPELSSSDGANDPPDFFLGFVVARIMPPTPASNSLALVVVEAPAATDEIGVGMGQFFWRSFTRNVDRVIKANSTAHVIPSAEAIAAQVLRQQQVHRND